MFALRVQRRTSHHAWQRRAYTVVDTIEDRKHRAPALTPSWSRRFRLEDADEEFDTVSPARRTVCIRMSRLAGGMVDAFSVIRGVERKFGRIREYRFIRDAEVKSEYQMMCWASFHSEDSMNLIPENGVNLNVTAATQDPTIPDGGVGLEHLQGLFDLQVVNYPSSSVSSTQGPSAKPRIIELNVQRAACDLRFHGETSPLNLTKAKRVAIGHSFYEWGGFYPLKPLYASSPFLSQPEELPPPDHEKMRIALNKWSQILNRPDPSFAQMELKAEAEAEALPETPVDDPVAMDLEPSSDLSVKLSKKSRRKTRREEEAWVPLTSQPTDDGPSSLDTTNHKIHKTSQPSTPKISRKERLLEQARTQARERVLEQIALRTREAESIDLEKPNSETLRESVVALLQDTKVDVKPQDATGGSEPEDGPAARDKVVGEKSAVPPKEQFWNLVGKWF